MAVNREQSPFGTVLTAMVTPMRPDGSIDYPGVGQLAEYLVANGNDGIVVNGVDLIHWNAEGRISDFKVMIRPWKAIEKIREKMAAMLQSM